MRRIAVTILTAASSACAPHYADLRERAAAEGWCNAAPAQRLIGLQATAAGGADALRLSGARFVEWIGPEVTIVTTAFSPQRLRISYNSARAITEITCG